MNRFLRGVARAVTESFTLPGPVLEVGSLQVDDRADLIDLRSLLPGREYTGVDFRPGPGVDRVANVERLPFPDASFGTVIALNTFEHVRRFWLGFAEVERVLRPDGVFFVSAPFHFPVHAYPSDYWRFTPEAFDSLLTDYPTRLLGWHGARRRMANVWAVAFKDKAAAPTEAELAAYRGRMVAYAHEPIGWKNRLRYQVGRLICGRRPFATLLDRDRWGLEVRTGAA